MKIHKTSFQLTIFILFISHLTHAYASSYQEVHKVVFNQAELLPSDDDTVKAEKTVYLANKLPVYQVSSGKFNQQVKQHLAKRTKQTLIDKLDYYPRLDKLVHSNGICMAGTWYMTEAPTNQNNQTYTGMFAKGASSAFIGRLSVTLSDTKIGKPLGFGLAGKIFGTNNKTKPVTTESFFTADVLSGAYRNSIYHTPMTNQPKIGFRLGVIGLGLKIAPLFGQADNNPGKRPVVGIAKMGLDKTTDVVTPSHMMVKALTPTNHKIIYGRDFRDEFALTTEDITNGIARYFAVYVADANKPKNKDWQHIGFIKADETVVSYGCDRQLHFAHPKDKP